MTATQGEDSQYREGALHALQVVRMGIERKISEEQMLWFLDHYTSQVEEWYLSQDRGQPPSGYGALGEAFARVERTN